VVEATVGHLDGDVVSRQPDVRVRVVIVLLDVGLEVVGVGDRSETWCQHREGGDCNFVAAVTDLSRVIIPCRGHDLRSRLMVQVGNQILSVAVVFLVLGTSLVLDVVALTLLTLQNRMH
jgi:hypothetical protein